MKEFFETYYLIGCGLCCGMPIGWMLLVIKTGKFPSKGLPAVESEEVGPKLAMVDIVMMTASVLSGLLDPFGGVSSSAVREGGLELGLKTDNGPQNSPSKN